MGTTANDKKIVLVYDIHTSKTKSLLTSNPYFCVMRLWDQWTETKMLKSHEDNYQAQIELMNNGLSFTHVEHIMAYYAMLCVRVWVANKERPNYPSIFTSISYEHNKSEMEDNEIEMEGPVHIIKSTLDVDSQHMARQVVKEAMNDEFIQWCNSLKNQNWKVYQSEGENFILSDAFYKNFVEGIHILPVSPKIVLVAESTYHLLESSGYFSASYINEIMMRNAVNYYLISNL